MCEMSKLARFFLMMAALAILFGASAARGACPPTCYVAANDDNPGGNTASIWVWNSSTGALTPFGSSPYSTGGAGLGGGYFGIPRNAISVGANGKCLFVGNGGTGDIAAFSYVPPSLTLVANYQSKGGYSGALYGIGLAIRGNALYANYSHSGVIDLWTIGPGCTLTDDNMTVTDAGGNGGVADGMTATTNCLVTAYADGTIGTYTASPFAFVSYYTAAGYTRYGNLPVVVRLAGTNLFADDFGPTGALYDSWPMNLTTCTLGADTMSGPLSGSIYGSDAFTIAPSSNLFFTVGNFSGTVQTNAVSGNTVSNSSCPDYHLTGYGVSWIYPGVSGRAANTNNGEGIVVAEASFGLSSSSYVETMLMDNNGCLTAGAQAADSSLYTLSLATFSGSQSN